MILDRRVLREIGFLAIARLEKGKKIEKGRSEVRPKVRISRREGEYLIIIIYKFI